MRSTSARLRPHVLCSLTAFLVACSSASTDAGNTSEGIASTSPSASGSGNTAAAATNTAAGNSSTGAPGNGANLNNAMSPTQQMMGQGGAGQAGVNPDATSSAQPVNTSQGMAGSAAMPPTASTNQPMMGNGGTQSDPPEMSMGGNMNPEPESGAAGETMVSEPEPLPPGICDNGMRDGDEEGPDCGGSCDPCPQYQMDPPQAGNEDRSGCENGGNGFMCARSLVFSPEMKMAAYDDWGQDESPFVYGVVGHDPDPDGVDGAGAGYSASCCQCYQLVFKGPRDGNISVPLPKPMIVQSFNTYAGGPTAFDVYMGVGGHGNFNGCTANGTQYSGYPDTGGDWSGGVRATRYNQCLGDMGYSEVSISADGCQGFIESECSQITSESPEVQATTQQSCTESNRPDTHYHMNWNVVAKRVECPEALTRVTGCQLNNQGLPEADPNITTVSDAMANGFLDGDYHTTTMQDCCRPTCAWDTNVQNTSGGWNRFYTCDKQNNVK